MADKVTVKQKIFRQIQDIRKQFVQAFPVILFFLLMFYIVLILFGTKYMMVVSLSTLYFQGNYKKQHTAGSIVLLLVQQMILAALAYVATWNIPLCLILNLVVPFWLIFSKSTPFNQMGYFSCLMTFAFLQLIPVDRSGFIVQMGALALCCVFVILAVLLYSRKINRKKLFHTEQKSMRILGTALEKIARGEGRADDAGELETLFDLQRTLYQEAYQQRGRRHAVTSAGKLKYMFAILMQRTIYLITSQSQILEPVNEEVKELEQLLAAYMKKAGETDFMENVPKYLVREGRRLLKTTEQEEGQFPQYAAEFLRMFLFILYQAGKKNKVLLNEQWEMPVREKLKERVLYRMRPDTFEMRFALRMSLVLMFSMAFNILFQEGHSYWLALNAFLLLRPMYEESRYRMRTRFIGTAAGCLVIAVVIPLCGALSVVHYAIASVMVACMYTATPGTIVHAFFVTCYALTMTTLVMGSGTAAFLRIAYVAAAVLLVLVVNRFFFPTSMGSQMRYNMQMLFHMHHMYLRILEDSLRNPPDYGRICDAQLQYHVVHGQISTELSKTAGKEEELYTRMLTLTWKMAAEIQQMFFLTAHKRGDPKVRQVMERYIDYTDYVLNQIQEMLHLRKEKKLKSIDGVQYQRYIDGNPQMSGLMTRYAKNLSRLYVLVATAIPTKL